MCSGKIKLCEKFTGIVAIFFFLKKKKGHTPKYFLD